MRVLILSPGHPDLQAGGAERAAYSLFERLRADRRVEAAAFAAPRTAGASGEHLQRPDVRLLDGPGVHSFTFRSKDRARLEQQIGELMAAFDPDVVHLHDFLHWSIELPEIIRQFGRACVLTLHEYALICTNMGQLVTPRGALCRSATPAACATCFPELKEQHFEARRYHLQQALSHADALVTPSAFAAERLVAWGLDRRQLAVLENLLPPDMPRRVSPRRTSPSDGPVVVGYFGQVTPFKGLEVLVRACAELVGIEGLEVRIHGANTHYRDAPFQREIDRRAKEAVRAGLLRFAGPYAHRDVLDLMRECHAVAVPSTWWENAPLVIREAKLAGCIVVCTDLGGMKEKTVSPPDLRFPVGRHEDLAALLRALAARGAADVRGAAAETLRILREDAAAFEGHVGLYYRVLAAA